MGGVRHAPFRGCELLAASGHTHKVTDLSRLCQPNIFAPARQGKGLTT